MRIVMRILVCMIVAVLVTGCGGAGGGPDKGYPFGVRYGAAVYMKPNPPARTFAPWAQTTLGIRINEVASLASIVHADGTNINESTSQVVFGQVAGDMTGKKVVVYSYTNNYYSQPLGATSINVRNDKSWIAPAHVGTVHALIVASDYAQPDVVFSLPVVDGTTVFASTP